MAAGGIYLASRSSRRADLLRQIGVPFEVLALREAPGRPCDIVEVPQQAEEPPAYVARLARLKAAIGWDRMDQRSRPPRPVLGADTSVILDGDILGKPKDAADAEAMLARLAGETHSVLTAVAMRWETTIAHGHSVSRVTFRPLSTAEIKRYVATGECFDKAGSYAIQGLAACFVCNLEGSYSGVVGLPLCETAELLAQFGLAVL